MIYLHHFDSNFQTETIHRRNDTFTSLQDVNASLRALSSPLPPSELSKIVYNTDIETTLDYVINLTSSVTDREPHNEIMEDFIVIWLDANIEQKDKLFDTRSRLSSIIHYIKTFRNIDDFMEYISTVKIEKIFLITSGSLGEQAVPLLENMQQILFIYIFCFAISEHKIWARKYSKIVGVYNDQNLLIDQLKNDVTCTSKLLTPMSVFSVDETGHSIQDLSEERINFLWFQLLIDILIHVSNTDDQFSKSESKKELIQKCRYHYKNNFTELKKIDEFTQQYLPSKVIYWYTRDCFMYRLLNKAFRTQDITMILKFRFFISDLYEKLYQMHKNYIQTLPMNNIVLYRGQHMFKTELKKLENSVGGFISMTTFLSTTTSSELALSFATDHPFAASVLFEFDIDVRHMDKAPFADIHQESEMKEENEVLLCVGSIFQIKSVELYTNDLWYISLKSCDEKNIQCKELVDYWKILDIKNPHLANMCTLGDIMMNMGDYEKAKICFKMHMTQTITNDQTGRRSIIVFYHPETQKALIGMATACLCQDDYVNALVNYAHALKIQLLSAGDVLAIIKLYDQIGYVYQLSGDYHSASYYYLQVLEKVNETYSTDQIEHAIAHVHLGKNFYHLEEYENALFEFKTTIEICSKLVQKQVLIYAYMGMANVNVKVHDYASALENVNLALNLLEIEASTTNDSHMLANFYRKAADIYAKLNENELAMLTYKRSLESALNIYSSNHPIVRNLHLRIAQQCLTWIKTDHSQAEYHIEKAADIYLHWKAPKLNECHSSTDKITMTDIDNSIVTNTIGADVTSQYLKLGIGYEEISDYDRALTCYTKALDILSKHVLVSDPEFVILSYTIARIYDRKNCHAEAFKLIIKTLTIRPECAQEYYPEVSILCNRFDKLQTRNPCELALKECEQILQLFLRYLPADNLASAIMFSNIGILHCDQNNYSRALESFEKALAITLNRVTPPITSVASIYYSIAVVHFKQKNYTKAVEIFNRVLEIYIMTLPSNDINLANLYNYIGKTYSFMRRYKDALPNCQKALRIFQEHVGNKHADTEEMFIRKLILCLKLEIYHRNPNVKVESKVICSNRYSKNTMFSYRTTPEDLVRIRTGLVWGSNSDSDSDHELDDDNNNNNNDSSAYSSTDEEVPNEIAVPLNAFRAYKDRYVRKQLHVERLGNSALKSGTNIITASKELSIKEK
ncbi:unnamed protein product [Didymodactylos carnosus]|uniref:NAD(P)(+)--arginine ADP-ribosyltransferase n=1 Tax=Didymodactylos carnosus TaxID=1234261 RepID=A0A815JSC6_9BILA|nr:unnamed protein product [Didymodactylos carnosus]CAF1385358.1 unnamed protein product [Didymodactylos carnosus]CAF3815972.1 unnamed protein product [Didymodactylos carnosus]CAF4280446.1 unnamed protein product [Didymodactylos carnosus]